VKSVDFERVLATPARMRSPHFAMHHFPDRPTSAAKPAAAAAQRSNLELSTSDAQTMLDIVDDSVSSAPTTLALLPRLWLGLVVPKRHARRAVTRNLFKRQMREAVNRHCAALPAGLWVLRLRAPFDKVRFPSAASDALKIAARLELDGLLCGAAVRKTPVARSHR